MTRRLCLFGALVLAGCSTAPQVIVLDPAPRARLAEASVRVYRTAAAVGCPYTEVALVQSEVGSESASDVERVRYGRRQAARLGADGLILGAFDGPIEADHVPDVALGIGVGRRGEMLAVAVAPSCDPPPRAR